VPIRDDGGNLDRKHSQCVGSDSPESMVRTKHRALLAATTRLRGTFSHRNPAPPMITTRERERKVIKNAPSPYNQTFPSPCKARDPTHERQPSTSQHKPRLFAPHPLSLALAQLDLDPLPRNRRWDPNPTRSHGTHTQIIPINHTRAGPGPRTHALSAWTWTWQR